MILNARNKIRYSPLGIIVPFANIGSENSTMLNGSGNNGSSPYTIISTMILLHLATIAYLAITGNICHRGHSTDNLHVGEGASSTFGSKSETWLHQMTFVECRFHVTVRINKVKLKRWRSHSQSDHRNFQINRQFSKRNGPKTNL